MCAFRVNYDSCLEIQSPRARCPEVCYYQGSVFSPPGVVEYSSLFFRPIHALFYDLWKPLYFLISLHPWNTEHVPSAQTGLSIGSLVTSRSSFAHDPPLQVQALLML